MPKRPVSHTQVTRVGDAQGRHTTDLVAVEEPLQIILEYGEPHARAEAPLAMTMRTPGDDLDLVRGFVLTSGIVQDANELLGVRYCVRAKYPDNAVRVSLRPGIAIPQWLLDRKMPSTSACGVCGAETIDALTEAGCEPLDTKQTFAQSAIYAAARTLEAPQTYFRHTGGTHAAAWFDQHGSLLSMREDVGRHNAMDKIVGAMMLQPHRSRASSFCVSSSRASFELVQKVVRARVPLFAALGAPSSLSIDLARRYNVTLLGFLSPERFNIYCGAARITGSTEDEHRAATETVP